MNYGPNFLQLFRRSAIYVDKILKGAKPADLPVQQPTEFELVVNLKTANALDIKMPQEILLRASRLITSKCGALRSRLSRLQLSTSRPAVRA